MSSRISAFNVGITHNLYVTDCPRCGVIFAVTEDYEQRRQSDGKTFYCPNDHPMSFRESDTERLRQAEAQLTHTQDQLRASIEQAERTRQALVRDRHRFANGVCPCCHRSFENVKRHMASQHPDYDIEVVKPPQFECSCGRVFETMRGLRAHQGWARGDDWAQPTTDVWHRHLTVVS